MRKTTQTHKLFAIFSVSMTYILKTFTETSNDYSPTENVHIIQELYCE